MTTKTVQSQDLKERKLHVITWGCQMNVYDSKRMEDVLGRLNFTPIETPEGADMIILNTCHIRERATEKVFSELGRLNLLKEERAARGAGTILAVAGCVAQAEGEEILRRAPYVDIILGPQTYHHLPELLAKAEGSRHSVTDIDFPEESKFDYLPDTRNSEKNALSAFLTVQEGCDKFCTYCVVPYTRGQEFSRPPEQILAEAKVLADRGVREITLLGQNVNAYHGENAAGKTVSLAGLIRFLADKLPEIARIRYVTSHPRDMQDDLIIAHGEIPQLMPFLHLPVQSGSDKILKAMNRQHKVADYYRIIEKLRRVRPDIALSSDFIVGFPGETEEDFNATLKLAEEIGFALAYSFKYSPRAGTPGADFEEQIAEKIKEERLAVLQKMLNRTAQAFNTGCVGRSLPVLFTGKGRHPGQIAGKTPYLQAVHVEGSEALIGQVAPVIVTELYPNSLAAVLA